MKYCFPFWTIEKSTKYAIYGAGNVGKDYYLTLPFFQWGQQVTWVDMNKTEACGYSLNKPYALENAEIDAVIIALMDAGEADRVRRVLQQVVSSDVDIIWVDPCGKDVVSNFLDWYYSSYEVGAPNETRTEIKCELADFSLEMLFMLVRYLDKYRLTYAEDGAYKGIALYGFICARKNNYPVLKHDSFLKVAYWPGEADDPDMSIIDYAFVGRDTNKSNCYNSRFFYPSDMNIQDRERFHDPVEMLNRRFCNFIYSNEKYGEGAELRKEFFTKLSGYKAIDSPGKVMHNYDGDDIEARGGNWHRSKLDFLRKYKFTIAFENQRFDGYSTEKLFDAFEAGSIPIYWGNRSISEDVNPECYIDCNDYDDDFDAVIDRIIEIDNDPELYMYMLGVSPMKKEYDFNHRNRFLNQWDEIVSRYCC